MKELNINNEILVRLHDAGYEHWKKKDDSVMPKEHQHTLDYYKSKADENGYVKFQAWVFIQTFGDAIEFGFRSVFDNNILIPDNSLENCSK